MHFATALTLLQMLADELAREVGVASRSTASRGTAAAAAAATAAAALDIYAPDTSGVMRRAIELAVNDAPWMSKRVRRSAVRLVHEKVPSAVCSSIGAQRLSELVTERLADGFVPSAAVGANSGAVEKIARVWAPNARSLEFRRALCRVMAHEATRAGTSPLFKSDPMVLSSLWALGDVQIIACGSIRSTFVLKGSGRDVTADGAESGSQALLHDGTLYLDTSPPGSGGTPSNLWVAVIVEVLNRSLRSAIQNLQPVGYALDAPHPVEIEGVLNYMKIAAYDESEDDDEIGVPVRSEDERALWPAGDGGDAVVGSLVAVVSSPGGMLSAAYGRIVARAPGGGDTYTIQVRADKGSGLSLTELVPRARLQIFRTAAEVRAAAEEAAQAGIAARAASNEQRRRTDAAAVAAANRDSQGAVALDASALGGGSAAPASGTAFVVSPSADARSFKNIAAKPISIRVAAKLKAKATRARIEPGAVFTAKAGAPTVEKLNRQAFVLAHYELADGSGWVLATHPKSGASLVEEVTEGGEHAASQSLRAADAFAAANFERAPVYTPLSKKSMKKGPPQGGTVDIVSEPPVDILPGRTRIGAATKRTLQPGGFERNALIDPSRSIKKVVRDRDLEARSAFLIESEDQQKRVFGSARIEYESTAVGAAVRNRNMVGGERFRKADFFVATVQVGSRQAPCAARAHLSLFISSAACSRRPPRTFPPWCPLRRAATPFA